MINVFPHVHSKTAHNNVCTPQLWAEKGSAKAGLTGLGSARCAAGRCLWLGAKLRQVSPICTGTELMCSWCRWTGRRQVLLGGGCQDMPLRASWLLAQATRHEPSGMRLRLDVCLQAGHKTIPREAATLEQIRHFRIRHRGRRDSGLTRQELGAVLFPSTLRRNLKLPCWILQHPQKG